MFENGKYFGLTPLRVLNFSEIEKGDGPLC